MIMVVGTSIGAIPLVIAADYTGDYDLTLLFLALLPATFSIAALFLKHPSQEQVSCEDSEFEADLAEMPALREKFHCFQKLVKR